MWPTPEMIVALLIVMGIAGGGFVGFAWCLMLTGRRYELQALELAAERRRAAQLKAQLAVARGAVGSVIDDATAAARALLDGKSVPLGSAATMLHRTLEAQEALDRAG